MRTTSRLTRAATAGMVLAFLVAGSPATAGKDRDAAPEWIRVDYSELLDRRQLSHSGESVGALLGRLGGRSLPAPGQRAEDRSAHALLDPLLEPYAFVLPDALDALRPPEGPPLVEVGSLWSPGQAQPAWVELLRARRYVVESDGQGRFRICLPWSGEAGGPAGPDVASTIAAEAAWTRAWPVLRHVFAAERRRRPGVTALEVEVHPYRHLPERSTFLLGTQALGRELDDTRGDGLRPPLDLDRIRRFLDGGLRLEGARIEADGSLRLLGSQTDTPPELLGRPLSLADLAVAYRAVFHGGLAEPYMSLDRGFSPQTSIVNYGGRLRDTALGLVSLLCDIRFKTFSLGLDIVSGQDLRDRLRGRLPDFRTHLERLAAHPGSEGMATQQTRLWFYPDAVDLTISAEGDVLVLRKVRMSAASERIQDPGAGPGEEAPWTRATVEAINRDYDGLARFFPEMADLDQVVRLLSLFTWLQSAEDGGYLLPELESLLALDLPALSTPRTFPQMLAFNILPAPGAASSVLVVDRVPYAEALSRLNPVSGQPLDPRRRYARAVAALRPTEPEHAAVLAELGNYNLEQMDDGAIDQLAYRAERVRMLAQTSVEHYRRLLTSLDPEIQQELAARQRRNEPLRPSTLGIGGLDLGMDQVLERARGKRLALTGDGSGPADARRTAGSAPSRTEPRQAREAWRVDPAGLPATRLPDHGLATAPGAPPAARSFGNHRIEVRAEGERPSTLVVTGRDGPEVRSRKLWLDSRGQVSSFERVEQLRLLRYRAEPSGEALTFRMLAPETAREPAAFGVEPPPPGLALLHVEAVGDALIEPPSLRLRMAATVDGVRRELEAQSPRAVLQRLVLGRQADPAPGQPLPGLSPLPPALGEIRSVMVVSDRLRWTPPWEGGISLLAGEEDPARVSRALRDWWSLESDGEPSATVGVDSASSPARWAAAPEPDDRALLWLPADGFPGRSAALRAELAARWTAGRTAETLPERLQTSLVVLVGADAPGTFAARLREAALHPAMKGKLLAAWSLAGPMRADLVASLLEEGHLAGLGLAEASVVGRRRAVEDIAALARALRAGGGRAERLPGPFLWHY